LPTPPHLGGNWDVMTQSLKAGLLACVDGSAGY
jgi:hypothetical protein